MKFILQPLFLQSRLLVLGQPVETPGRDTLARQLGRIYPFIVTLVSLFVPILAALAALPFALVFYFWEVGWRNAGHLTPLLPSSLKETILLVLSFVPIYFIVWGWLYLFERRHLWSAGFERDRAVKKYGWGLLGGVGMMAVAVVLASLPGFFGAVRDGARSISLPVLAEVLVIFLGWIVQGAGEEVLCRGFLLQIASRRWGLPAGILVSSLLFSMLHLLNPHLSILAVVNLFLYGVFAAFYALHEGSLWGISALHTAWNWAEGNLFGQSVSGGIFGGVSLFKVHLAGPAWWTGGDFGPEGGLIVTTVLLAGIALIWAVNRRESARMGQEGKT